MTKNIGNKTLNERATAGGTAAGIVMVILGFRAKRQNISLVINATITATNNSLRAEIFGRQECLPIYHLVWGINNKNAPIAVNPHKRSSCS